MNRLAGMTGTAMTEANEFKEIYKLEVLEIPTYRNCQRERCRRRNLHDRARKIQRDPQRDQRNP